MHTSELLQVFIHMPLVPRSEDGLEIRKIFVEGRASNAGFRGNLRHGHRGHAVLCHKLGDRIEGCIVHRLAVRFNRIAPNLRHLVIIHDFKYRDILQLTKTRCLDKISPSGNTTMEDHNG